MARCPYSPQHNSTALLTSSGELYAATAMDFPGRDPAIYRSLGALPPLRTAQYNSKWLNGECWWTVRLLFLNLCSSYSWYWNSILRIWMFLEYFLFNFLIILLFLYIILLVWLLGNLVYVTEVCRCALKYMSFFAGTGMRYTFSALTWQSWVSFEQQLALSILFWVPQKPKAENKQFRTDWILLAFHAGPSLDKRRKLSFQAA